MSPVSSADGEERIKGQNRDGQDKKGNTATGKRKGIEVKDNDDGLMFELSEDTSDVVSEIQRNISPVNEGALSII